jgi:hypothetical protein
MKYKKRNIYIIIFSIFTYLLVTFLYNKFILNDKFIEICVLNKDFKRGDKISEDSIFLLKVNIENKNIQYLSKEEVIGKILKNDFCQGQLLTKDLIEDKSTYINPSDGKEIVTIPIKNAYDIVSYRIEKGSIVNIYYTGKASQLNNFINSSNLENITSSGTSDSYTTIKILENVKIIDIFDKYGNSIKIDKSDTKNKDFQIDAIMVETTKEKVMKISNIKNYGTFNISILK